MIRTFFQKLPPALFESAKIDGANEFVIFFRIALPLSVPVLTTVAFFTAMSKWNDWQTGLLYITQENMEPLQYMLYRIEQNIQSLLTALGPVSYTHLGLIRCGGAIIPFENSFPKNTKLYQLMTTKPNEKFL